MKSARIKQRLIWGVAGGLIVIALVVAHEIGHMRGRQTLAFPVHSGREGTHAPGNVEFFVIDKLGKRYGPYISALPSSGETLRIGENKVFKVLNVEYHLQVQKVGNSDQHVETNYHVHVEEEANHSRSN